MKQKLLSMMLLLFALIVGSGTMWGADETVTININSFTDLPSGNASYATYNWSQGGITGKATIFANQNSTSMQFNASNYLFYSTSAISGTIKSIKLTTASGTNRTYVVYGSTSAYSGSGTSYGTQIGSQTVTTSGTTYTVSSGEYNYFTIVKSGSGAGYLSSVEVTYTTGGGSSAVETTTTIDDSGITNIDVYEDTAAGTLTASVTETVSGDAVDGATVTWSGDNDDVAIIDETTGAVTLVAAGTVTFTASYAGVTDEYQASSNTYEMTVTNSEPYVQPTSVTVNMNNTIIENLSAGSRITKETTTTIDNVSITFNKESSGSNYPQFDSDVIRMYANTYFTIGAPTGYDITKVVFTDTYSWSGVTASADGLNTTNRTWEGKASSIEFSFSAQCRPSKMVITLAEQKNAPSLTVSTAELSLGYGETKSFTVSKTGDGTLTVVSNNTGVATVAADGETAGQYNVTYVGDGSTTITVSSSETATYAGDTKTVSITAADARSAAGISFANASQSAVIADGTSFKQNLTNANSVSPITWTSSNNDVATVASDGTVTLKTAGTVTITASFAGDATYKPAEVSYTLTITNKHVAELVFNADAIEKNSTDAPFTNAITTDPDPIDVVYSSSDTDVATVNASTGEVTIVGGGTTTITATINDDDYEATEFTYTLTVNKVAAPISFSSASATTAIDETESFVAPTLSNPQSLTIAYSSSNTDVATVDAGTGAITFKAVGNTTITATSTATAKYNAGEATYTLTVTKAAENLPFSAALTSTLGDFTVTEDATLGELWAINSSSAKASAYKNGNNAGESWLISPYINITSAYATLSFQHAQQYFGNASAMTSEATLWIREQGGDWEQLTIATYPEYTARTTKSDFVSTSNSLSSYYGKKVQIGFKYLGNTTSAGSWFVKNFRVADDREEAPISFADATVYELLKNKDTYTGQELTNDEDLTVSYNSSNTDVATVDASTGVVTIKAVGETNITATYTESASYKANTATYRLVVTSKTAPAIEYAEDAVSKKITLGTYTHELTNPNDLTVAYSSSDETVATVNASTGEVTMLKVGETTITATFTEDEDYDGGTASYTLTVIKDDPVLSFANSSVNAALADGTYTQAVTTTPADLPVTYSSSDETVATVNASTGEATLLKAGSTTITATFAGNDSYNSTNTTYTLTVVIDYATLPFSYNTGKSNIASTTGLSESGLGSDYSTAPKLKFDGSGDYLILKIGEIPGELSFDIQGNGYSAGSTSTFKIQTSVDGETYTDIATYTELDNTTNKKFNLAGDVRYIKWLYKEKGASSGGNVGLGNISVTKTNTITLAEACTDGSKYYGTYSLGKAFIVPSDLTVSEITVENGKLQLTNYETDDVVPANTGVMVSSTTAGNHSVTVSTGGTSMLGSDNMLKASGDAGITAVNMNETNTKFYRLTMHEGTQIGFWWGAEDGAAFALAANKAYLAVPNTVAGVRMGFAFGDDAAGIASMQRDECVMHNEVYNLQGQRVKANQKGIVIVNGKKVVIK